MQAGKTYRDLTGCLIKINKVEGDSAEYSCLNQAGQIVKGKLPIDYFLTNTYEVMPPEPSNLVEFLERIYYQS